MGGKVEVREEGGREVIDRILDSQQHAMLSEMEVFFVVGVEW